MKKVLLFNCFCFCSVLYSAGVLNAVVPNVINYQGRYREYNQPIIGTRTMSFTIYDASTNGNQVWTSGAQTVQVSNGIFSIQLTPAVDLRAISTGSLYLEIDVTPVGGGSPKALLPREQLTANWYALHAATAEGISISNGQNIQFIIGSSTPMVITSNGNVGVGVTNPQYTLDISSSVRINSGMLFFPDGSSMTTAGVASVGAVSANGNVPITAGVSGAGDIQLYTGTNEQMIIKYNGKVGVGTANPDQVLSVNGNIDQTGVIISSGTGNNYFAGNVGIGTTNPLAMLHIAQNNSNTHLMLTEASSDNVGPAIISQKARNTIANPMTPSGNDVLYQVRLQPYVNSMYRDIGEAINVTAEDVPSGNYLPTRLQLCTASTSSNTTPKVTITSDGKMGVGTTSPSSKFELSNGTMTATALAGAWDQSTNGYIRLGNLQICWGKVKMYDGTADGSVYTKTITYPMPYIENTTVFTQFASGAYGDYQQTNSSYTSGEGLTNFLLNVPTSSGWGPVWISWIAIGRWQ